MKRNESKLSKQLTDVDNNICRSIKKEAGLKLLSMRKESDYSLQEVADAIGISRAALSYYEKGERSADIETLYKLAAFYDISVDYLFGLKDSPSPEHNISSVNELKEIGFSMEALDKMWSKPDFVMFINDLVTHKGFQELEDLTYRSHCTRYKEIDNGYRSFLTSRLLYSMMAEIFTNWDMNNPDKIKD